MSDLDGTLLNNHGEMSDVAADMLNRSIELGIQFSVNTARTPATVFPIMKNVQLNVPFSMMNGVLIYNPVDAQYLKIHYMKPETAMVALAPRREKSGCCARKASRMGTSSRTAVLHVYNGR